MEKEEGFEFLGINKWHEAGYTGSRVKIVSDERIIKDYNKDDKWAKVICPKGYQTNESKWHGSSVMSILLDVCPDAQYTAFPFSVNSKCECADYIIENKVNLFTSSSVGQYPNKTKQEFLQKCIDAGCTFFIAGGNNGDEGMLEESKSDKYLAIGIADMVKGRLQRVDPSSIGKELDYVELAMYGRWSSWTTPTMCAMCGLVQDFFINKTGRALKRDELIGFIDDNLIDLEEKGFDVKTGNGLFILPEISSIDISKYVPEYKGSDNVRGIYKLHPKLQIAVNKLLIECKKQGLDVIITETIRTQAEQEALYAQGRTKPGKIITNCIGYQSPHCWGIAFDFCRNKKGWEYDNTDGFFDKVGQIAKTIFDNTEYDLFWGGDFKSFVDRPHIEMIKFMPNNSTKWLIDTYGTPEEFMKTWESEVEEMPRYKTIDEMPEYYRKDIQELINRGIIAGRGGDAGLDLSDDMCRMAIYAKKIFEGGE